VNGIQWTVIGNRWAVLLRITVHRLRITECQVGL